MRFLLYLEFLWTLLLTIIIESAAILVIFRRKKYIYYSVLCNLLTNPAMNLLLAASIATLGAGAYYPTLVIAELAVIFVEAAVYKYICGFGVKKSVMLSTFLNALSFTTGILLNWAAFV